LPEAALAAAPARGGIEAALDHREERKARRHAVRLEDPAQTGQVARPARQALRRLPAEPGVRAEPVLPGVDALVVGRLQAAQRGFHRTTVRDIAARARVNVAAGHYHYGSKRALYLAVLRAQFADVRATLQARGAAVPEGELRALSRRQLAALLRTRVNVMLD